jgi:hypothetical protein
MTRSHGIGPSYLMRLFLNLDTLLVVSVSAMNPLDSVANDLDHNKLDGELIDDGFFTVVDEADLEPPLIALMLSRIVLHSPELNQDYASPRLAKELLVKHPVLVEKFKEAWRTKSFKEIVNLSTHNQ